MSRGFSLIESVIALALLFMCASIIATTEVGGIARMMDWINEERAYLSADTLLRKSRVVLVQDFDATSTDESVSIDDASAMIRTMIATVPWRSSTGTTSVSLSEDIYNWRHADGGDTCDMASTTGMWKQISSITLPQLVTITGLDVFNGHIYVAVDSATASDTDLYIIDISSSTSPIVTSLLDTGTGSVGVRAISGFIFLAEQSARHPLRVVDISNLASPRTVYEYTSTASSSVTGYGAGNALYYRDKRLYLGTKKSLAPELLVFDVTNPANPQKIGIYETDTQINDIIAKNNTVYIATPGEKQMQVLDASTMSDIRETTSVTASGYGVQDGRALYLIGKTLYLGRTVGGFDNASNHELFAYDVSTSSQPTLKWSLNIGSTINTVLVNRNRALLAIGNSKNALAIYDISSSTPTITQSILQGRTVVGIDCENDLIAVGHESPAVINLYTQ